MGNGAQKSRISPLAAGFQFAVCVMIPLAVGAYVDRRIGCRPWGALGGALVGMAAGTWSVFRPLWLEANEADHSQPPHKNNDEL